MNGIVANLPYEAYMSCDAEVERLRAEVAVLKSERENSMRLAAWSGYNAGMKDTLSGNLIHFDEIVKKYGPNLGGIEDIKG